MIHIDGSHGEGGGQIVRSALALSLVTGAPLELSRIRAGRSRSGLLAQHLAAVRAAAELGAAEVEGDRLRSSRLRFRPGTVRGGEYHFQVGTAGSAVLVLQTVLPALLRAEHPARLVLEGGTHNPFAPPFDFLATTYLPLLGQMGVRAEARLERYGFYPVGGGRFTIEVQPAATLGGLTLLERGPIRRRDVRAVVARLPMSIAERECRTIAQATGWPPGCFQTLAVDNAGSPGNYVSIELQCESLTELFTGFGKLGTPAEKVARGVLREARRYERADVPVGEHLADQLLLPLAVAAFADRAPSRFRTGPLTPHAETQIHVIREFLDIRLETRVEGDARELAVLPRH